MSPQFVDFDGDGELDILTATFDGAVHLARGDRNAWHDPAHVLDARRQRIVLNKFHSRKTKWTVTHRCDPKEGAPAEGHLTAAVAVDVDDDGDLDLILGDHAHGYLYVRRNTGKVSRPAFGSRNELVRSGGEPIRIPNGIMSLRVVDWNGDQRSDLLVTSGDGLAIAPGAGVFVCLDIGQPGRWTPAEPVPLLPECDRRLQTQPTRVTHGVYADLGDIDGDGDLDLLVGGYAAWRTHAESVDGPSGYEMAMLMRESAELAGEIARHAVDQRRATRGLTDREKNERLTELLKNGGLQAQFASGAKRQELQQRIATVLPVEKKETFVWLYENLGEDADGSRRRTRTPPSGR